MGLGSQETFPQEYVCQLPEAAKKTALEELREDDSMREQSLTQMREWINKHPNIKRCRTGEGKLRIVKIVLKKAYFSKLDTMLCSLFHF